MNLRSRAGPDFGAGPEWQEWAASGLFDQPHDQKQDDRTDRGVKDRA